VEVYWLPLRDRIWARVSAAAHMLRIAFTIASKPHDGRMLARVAGIPYHPIAGDDG
jgi:hypothetical protein